MAKKYLDSVGLTHAFSKIKNMSHVKETTWSALKTLRDNSQLVAGWWYRITDYTCTTTQNDTQSAGHVFDILVRADDASHLNENTYAMYHSGDTYFADSKLAAWELKYCLDNDTDRFAWADSTNGKGVVFYMKDEFGNECGYDFKNIQMKFYKITAVTTVPSALLNTYSVSKVINTSEYTITSGCTVDANSFEWRYTFDLFTDSTHSDYSMNNFGEGIMCSNNILPAAHGNNKQIINYVSFRNAANDDDCYSNKFGDECSNISCGGNCCLNIFGDSSMKITIGNHYYWNKADAAFVGNIFSDYVILCNFGFGFNNNILGYYSYGNTFGAYCTDNILGDNCATNVFGGECYNITLADDNMFNTFGTGCHHISLPKAYGWLITFETGNHHITLTTSDTTSSSKYLRNITIAKGVNMTNTTKTITHPTAGDDFNTIYQPANHNIVSV